MNRKSEKKEISRDMLQVSVWIDKDMIEEVDRLVKRNNSISGNEYTRSTIIRKAIRKFIEKN